MWNHFPKCFQVFTFPLVHESSQGLMSLQALISDLKIFVSMVRVKYRLIMILLCVYLMVDEVDCPSIVYFHIHFFFKLLALPILKYSPKFSTVLITIFTLTWEEFFLSSQIFCQLLWYILFLITCGLYIHSCYAVFDKCVVSALMKPHVSIFSFQPCIF